MKQIRVGDGLMSGSGIGIDGGSGYLKEKSA